MKNCSGVIFEGNTDEHADGRERKRWTAKCKAAMVMEIIQGKTTVADASRSFDLPHSEIDEWVHEAKKGIDNALRSKPLDIKELHKGDLLICRRRIWLSDVRVSFLKGGLPSWQRVRELILGLKQGLTAVRSPWSSCASVLGLPEARSNIEHEGPAQAASGVLRPIKTMIEEPPSFLTIGRWRICWTSQEHGATVF